MSYLIGAHGVRLRFTDRGPGSDRAGSDRAASDRAGSDRAGGGAETRADGESPAIVLVHGWKGSHRLWDPVVARAAEWAHVVAFDLRGMGESDKPRCAYDFDELADDLGVVIDSLGLRDVVLVGWSMGTTVSLRYLERGGTGVSRLIIVNGPLRLTRVSDFPHAMDETELDGYVRSLRDRWPAGEREFQAHTLLEPEPAVVDWLYGIALQTPLEVALRLVEQQARLDMRDAVAGLEIPVLAAYSTNDPYYPPSLAQYIAERARDGAHVLFDRSRHCIPLEEPDKFCQVLREFAA